VAAPIQKDNVKQSKVKVVSHSSIKKLLEKTY
jgi:hypothetical protein